MTSGRRLWLGLLALALLSPLGLYLPALMHGGPAWGEWGREELHALLGYLPAGMERTADLWQAPLPDYATRGPGQASLPQRGLAYAVSALVGVSACAAAVYLVGRWLCRKQP